MVYCRTRLLGLWHRQTALLEHSYRELKIVDFGYAFRIAYKNELSFVIDKF